MRRGTTFGAFLGLLWMLGAAACAPAQDGPPPMTREQAIRSVTAEDLAEDGRIAAAYGLGRAIEPGDYAAWERVRPVIESESAPTQLRSVLVWVFAEKADERIAGEMLSMALAWNEQIEGHRAEAVAAGEREAWRMLPAAPLLSSFLYRYNGTPLRDFVPRDARALDLAESVALRGRPHDEGAGTTIYHILLHSRAPPERITRSRRG